MTQKKIRSRSPSSPSRFWLRFLRESSETTRKASFQRHASLTLLNGDSFTNSRKRCLPSRDSTKVGQEEGDLPLSGAPLDGGQSERPVTSENPSLGYASKTLDDPRPFFPPLHNAAHKHAPVRKRREIRLSAISRHGV